MVDMESPEYVGAVNPFKAVYNIFTVVDIAVLLIVAGTVTETEKVLLAVTDTDCVLEPAVKVTVPVDEKLVPVNVKVFT